MGKYDTLFSLRNQLDQSGMIRSGHSVVDEEAPEMRHQVDAGLSPEPLASPPPPQPRAGKYAVLFDALPETTAPQAPPTAPPPGKYASLFAAPEADMYDSAGRETGVNPNFLRAVNYGETASGKYLESETGVRGEFQLTLSTAKQYGVDREDPAQAALGAARLIADLQKQFDGDAEAVLSAYNTGAGVVKEAQQLARQKGTDWRDEIGNTRLIDSVVHDIVRAKGIEALPFEREKLNKIAEVKQHRERIVEYYRKNFGAAEPPRQDAAAAAKNWFSGRRAEEQQRPRHETGERIPMGPPGSPQVVEDELAGVTVPKGEPGSEQRQVWEIMKKHGTTQQARDLRDDEEWARNNRTLGGRIGDVLFGAEKHTEALRELLNKGAEIEKKIAPPAEEPEGAAGAGGLDGPTAPHEWGYLTRAQADRQYSPPQKPQYERNEAMKQLTPEERSIYRQYQFAKPLAFLYSATSAAASQIPFAGQGQGPLAEAAREEHPVAAGVGGFLMNVYMMKAGYAPAVGAGMKTAAPAIKYFPKLERAMTAAATFAARSGAMSASEMVQGKKNIGEALLDGAGSAAFGGMLSTIGMTVKPGWENVAAYIAGGTLFDVGMDLAKGDIPEMVDENGEFTDAAKEYAVSKLWSAGLYAGYALHDNISGKTFKTQDQLAKLAELMQKPVQEVHYQILVKSGGLHDKGTGDVIRPKGLHTSTGPLAKLRELGEVKRLYKWLEGRDLSKIEMYVGSEAAAKAKDAGVRDKWSQAQKTQKPGQAQKALPGTSAEKEWNKKIFEAWEFAEKHGVELDGIIESSAAARGGALPKKDGVEIPRGYPAKYKFKGTHNGKAFTVEAATLAEAETRLGAIKGGSPTSSAAPASTPPLDRKAMAAQGKKIAKELGIRFDGIQEDRNGNPLHMQFTPGTENAPGSSFYAKDAAQARQIIDEQNARATPTATAQDKAPPTPVAPDPAARAVAPENSAVAGQEYASAPTPAQARAGNYKKAPLRRDGLNITIENPVGSPRSDKHHTPPEWTTIMRADYGQILGTKGRDGDPIDVFIRPDSEEGGMVFVVNQMTPKTGEFDEHKVMLGYPDQATAQTGYLENYEPGWKGMGEVVPVTPDELQGWLESGETQAPLSREWFDGEGEAPAFTLSQIRDMAEADAAPGQIVAPSPEAPYIKGEVPALPTSETGVAPDEGRDAANLPEPALADDGYPADWDLSFGGPDLTPDEHSEIRGFFPSDAQENTEYSEVFTTDPVSEAEADYAVAKFQHDLYHILKAEIRDTFEKIASKEGHPYEWVGEQVKEQIAILRGEETAGRFGNRLRVHPEIEKLFEDTAENYNEYAAAGQSSLSDIRHLLDVDDNIQGDDVRFWFENATVSPFSLQKIKGDITRAKAKVKAEQEAQTAEYEAKQKAAAKAKREAAKAAKKPPLQSAGKKGSDAPQASQRGRDTGVGETSQQKAKDTPSIVALRSALSEYFGVDVSPSHLSAAVRPAGPEAEIIETEIARVFGKDIRWVNLLPDFVTQTGTSFNGLVAPNTRNPDLRDQVFIATDAEKPLLWVAGHELSHLLEQDRPDLYDALWDAVEPLLADTAFAEIKRLADETRRGEAIGRSELMANLVGDFFTEPQFWGNLSMRNPGAFREIARRVIEILNRIIRSIRGKFGQTKHGKAFIKDLVSARTAVSKAVSAYAESQGNAKQAAAGMRAAFAGLRKAGNPQFAKRSSKDQVDLFAAPQEVAKAAKKAPPAKYVTGDMFAGTEVELTPEQKKQAALERSRKETKEAIALEEQRREKKSKEGADFTGLPLLESADVGPVRATAQQQLLFARRPIDKPEDVGYTREDVDTIYGSLKKLQEADLEIQKELSALESSRQLDLFYDAPAAPAQKRAPRKHARRAESTLQGIGPARKSLVPGTWAKHRRIDLTGHTIDSPTTLAELFSVYRHPRIEHVHLVYVDDTGKVLAHNAMSSGLINQSVALERPDASVTWRRVANRMKRLGASGYYLVHNHPGGSTNPSVSDRNLTEKYRENVPNFLGHVILDHDKYGFIDGNLKASVDQYIPKVDFEDYTQKAGLPIMGVGSVALLTRNVLQDPKKTVVVVVDHAHRPVAWYPVSKPLELTSDKIHQFVQEGAGAHAFVATNDDESFIAATKLMGDSRSQVSSLRATNRINTVRREQGMKVLPQGKGQRVFDDIMDVVHVGNGNAPIIKSAFLSVLGQGPNAGKVAVGTRDKGFVWESRGAGEDQTRTPAFKKWFEGSKVVGKDGAPLVVYRGAFVEPPTKFEKPALRGGKLGVAFFTSSKDVASAYAITGEPQLGKKTGEVIEGAPDGIGSIPKDEVRSSVMPAYLNIKKPLDDYTGVEDVFDNPETALSWLVDEMSEQSAEQIRGMIDDGDPVAEIWEAFNEDAFEGAFAEEAALSFSDNNILHALASAATKYEKFRTYLKRRGFDGWAFDDAEAGGVTYVPFAANQIKSATGNTGAFDPENPDIRFARREDQTRTPAFKKWFGDSKVVDEKGRPLVVYRGQHGKTDKQVHGRRGSIAFGDKETASTYALYPNDGDDTAHSPRVMPAYLSIKNPIFNTDDIAAYFSDLAEKLGPEVAAAFAIKHADTIEEMGYWEEEYADTYDGVAALLKQDPDAINRLDIDGYKLLDDHEFVAAAKKAGYDGAILAGVGENALEPEYHIFDESQIKSAIGNTGAFDPENPDIRFARKEEKRTPAPAFFSPTERALDAIDQEKGVVPRIKSMLRTGKLKKAEADWMGLEQWLEENPRATKAEVLEFVRSNEVQVEEVRLGEDKKVELAQKREALADYGYQAVEEMTDAEAAAEYDGNPWFENVVPKSATKYDDYTLPGGENYREVLLTLPGEREPWLTVRPSGEGYEVLGFDGAPLGTIDQANSGNWVVGGIGDLSKRHYATEQEAIDAVTWRDVESKKYESSHWEEANIIAHTRLNDRTGPDGERVLFIEEIQSDWARSAREKGVALSPEQEARWTELANIFDGRTAEQAEEFNALHKQKYKGGVPNQPFLKNWQELTMKRVLRLAAEEGYDRVAWINGEQTADRYDLSKKINEVSVEGVEEADGVHFVDMAMQSGGQMALEVENGTIREGDFRGKPLEDVVGKELAAKILAVPKGETKLFSGLDLKVGGRWARNLYDVQIPKFLEKYGKKWGVAVEGVPLKTMYTQASKVDEGLLRKAAINAQAAGDSESAAFLSKQADRMAKGEEPHGAIYNTNEPASKFVDDLREDLDPQTTQQSIPITPEMRESVLYEGQPMFARRPKKPDGSAKVERIPVKPKGAKARPERKKKPEAAGTLFNARLSEVEQIESEVRRLRHKLRDLSPNRMLERASIQLKINQYDTVRHNQVVAEIYDYAKKLRLSRYAFNRVDTLMKNSRTAASLRQAVAIMDDTIQRREKGEAYKKLMNLIEGEYRRLHAVQGKTMSTVDLETNRHLKVYLDHLTDATSEELARLDKAIAYIQNYSRKDIKQNPDFDPSKLPKAYRDAITEWLEDPKKSVPESLRQDIRAVFETNLAEMTTEQLQEVRQNILDIKATGRTRRQAARDAAKAELEESAARIVERLEVDVEKMPQALMNQERRQRNKLLESARSTGHKILFENLRPERIVEWFEGFQRGELTEKVFTPLYEAAKSKHTSLEKALARFDEIHAGIDFAEVSSKPFMNVGILHEDKKTGKKVEKEVRLTLDQMMFIYAHSQNPGNRAHLYGTGYDDIAIEAVTNRLPDEYRRVVDAMIDYNDIEQYPRMNEAFIAEHEMDMPKEHRYFRIMNLAGDKAVEGQLMADVLARYGSRRAMVQKGMTRQRVQSNTPFERESYLETAIKSIIEAEHYITHSGPVRQVMQYLNHKDLKPALQAKSPDAYKALNDWVKHVAYGKLPPAETWFERFTTYLRRNYVTSVLGGNIVTILKQPASFVQGVGMLNNKANAVPAALRTFWDSVKMVATSNPADYVGGKVLPESIAFMIDKSAAMRMRMNSIEREFMEQLEKGRLKKALKAQGLWDKFREFSMSGIQAADMCTVSTIWNARYGEVLNETMDEAKAIEAADYAVRRTQPMGTMIDLPASFRTGPALRAFSMFLNQPNQNFNLFVELIGKWDKTPTAENASRAFWWILAPATVLYMASNGGRGPWEDPEGWADFIVDTMTGGVVFLNWVADAATTNVTNRFRRARGKKPASTWNRTFTNPVLDVITEGGAVARGERSLRRTLEFGAKFSGVPGLAQANRTARGVEHVAETKDLRYAIWSKSALEDPSVESAMASRLLSSKREDKLQASEWLSKASEKQRTKFYLELERKRQDRQKR